MIGEVVRHLEVCTSTNDEAARWARDETAPAPHGAVVVARSQTAGRGRLGRVWHSPSGKNLYMSVVLRPALEPRAVAPITLCAGLAVADAVNSAGVRASIKWPNDVLVGGRKIAGILTEMSTRGAELEHVIVGIGVNLNERPMPAELAATSLAAELGAEVDGERFRRQLESRLDAWIARFVAGGAAALAEAFGARSALADRRITAIVEGRRVVGRALGIDDEGALVMEVDGQRARVVAGEVAVVGETP